MKKYIENTEENCTYEEFYNHKKKHEYKRNRNKSERERRESLEDMEYED